MSTTGNVVRRRWNEARVAMRADDFEAFIDLDSSANRHLMMLLFGTLCFFASVVGTAVVLPYADRLDLAVDATLIRCVLAGTLGLATLLIPGRRVPMWVIDAVVVSAVTFIGFAVAATPQPIAGYLVLFYLWPITALVVLRSERACLVHYAYVAVTSGLVFAFDDDFTSKPFWWGMCLLMAAVVWWSTGWLVRHARHLAAVERETRARAEHASRSLVELNRQKSQFLGAMSHELRTPLNAVIGFAQMLRRRVAGPLNDSQALYVDDIVESGEHLLALIDDTLDDAKVESGEYRLDPTEVVVAELIDDAVRFVRERAEHDRIELRVRAEPLSTVRLDERKVRQVLVNLLSNAVKFTPDGGLVTVRARRTARETVFVVEDTGPGVPPEAQHTVFDEFEQAGSATAEGTGLGLAVARAFVELHGGHIAVDSPPTGGARFSFSIPNRLPAQTVKGAQPRDGTSSAPHTSRAEIVEVGEIVDRMLVMGAAIFIGLTVGLLVIDTPGASREFLLGGIGLVFVLLPPLALSRGRSRDKPAAVLGLAINSVITIAALVGIHQLGELGPGAVLVIVGTGIFFRLFGHASGLLAHPGRTHAAIAGVGIAVALGSSDGNTALVLQWTIAMCTLGVGSLLIGSLFDRLRLLLDAERFAAEQAAAVAAELHDVSRHKSQFLAGMSHELRTPLNAVIGFAEALEREIPGPLTAAQRAYVGDIAQAGRHLLEVINQTLDLAKLDAGRLELDLRDIELAALLDLALAPSRKLARASGITVDVPDVPDTTVRADEARMSQAIGAIARNAVQFTPPEEAVTITVEDGADHVWLAIADHGPGIDVTQQVAIFEPFNQGDAEPTRAREGAGLGLTLARRLIELHGGTVGVTSARGEGTTFTLSVPRAGDPADAASADAVVGRS